MDKQTSELLLPSFSKIRFESPTYRRTEWKTANGCILVNQEGVDELVLHKGIAKELK